ncbi:hypothetical protein P7C73_g3740, partial [Tremellales sp. Uapishka_1]
MPTPLSPCSSQEIIPISPPIQSTSKLPPKSAYKPIASVAAGEHHDRKGKRKMRAEEEEIQRERSRKLSRAQVTAQMVGLQVHSPYALTKENVDVDAGKGCQSNHELRSALEDGLLRLVRNGTPAIESWGWKCRGEELLGYEEGEDGGSGARKGKRTDILAGCVFYLNGSTGPKVSNLQLQNMIAQNGGRHSPHATSSCTHIIANGGLSGTKTQKYIDGQGGRGGLKRLKVIRADWVLDCVDKGYRLSEAGYGMIDDPSQPNLFKAFGVKPKLESEVSDSR